MADVCEVPGCGRTFEQPPTGGKRRKCTDCSPPVRRPERNAPVVTLNPDRAARSAGRRKAPPPSPPVPRRTLLVAVLEELSAVDRQDTPDGIAALQLAETSDAGGWPASSAKALHEALRDARRIATEGTAPTADVIDLIFGAEA